jgi:hypothetical protein
LGAISDFSDSLVDFAFERQTRCDVLNEPYYYECIQSIAKQRSSEDLQLKTTILESKGLVSRRDLSEAYRFFNLNSDSRSVDDDRIFNLFQAQHADSGVHGQERAREMLGRIGRSRGSKMLINASQQTIETVEEAYQWIGNNLGPDADDSFVVTMLTVKVSPSLPFGSFPVCTWPCLPRFACDNNKLLHPQQNTDLTYRLTATKSWKRSVAKLYQLLRANATAVFLKVGSKETTLARQP